MSMFTKTANTSWLKMKSAFSAGKYLNYDAYSTYVLVVFTLILTVEREYTAKTAKLTMEWFGLDNEESIQEYVNVIKEDRYLVLGDRLSILNMIMKQKFTSEDQSTYEEFLSSPQWLSSMLFVGKKMLNHSYGVVDQSALFPTNITKQRVDSYRSNPTKVPVMRKSIKFVNSLMVIGSRAMKIHLISITTSLMWYSNDDIWNREHNNMWVNGNKADEWLDRRARLNLEIGQPLIARGIY